jgi:site-specific DNA recombinase
VLTRTFEPRLEYSYVLYGRMSSDNQNPKSPDQQFDTIERTRLRLGYPWRHLKSYRDDAVSGRLVKKRSGLQEMLREIQTKQLRPDLILVDTWERFGRAEELTGTRQKLKTQYGVLIVSADNGFADPTTAVGQMTSSFEAVRAVEDNRIRAHTVLRGQLTDFERRNRKDRLAESLNMSGRYVWQKSTSYV